MGLRTSNEDEIMSEINVTPLVDVMLVLLVIFMISAPLMYNGISLNLPKTQKVNNLQLSSEKIILSIDQAEDFYLGDQKVLKSELISMLQELKKDKNTEDIFVRADAQVKYGTVAQTFAYLKSQGITSVSLITEIEK